MVESDVDGRCPRCGTPSPRISSAQQTVVAVARRRRWLPAAIVAALIAIGVVGVPRVLERLHHPSESVAGELRSAHLGVRLQFPEGWRHLREGDRAPSTALDVLGDAFGDPLSLRSSRFFRGAAGDPAAELFVVVGARAGGLGDAALASWAQAVAETPEKLEGPVRDLTGVKDLRMFQCTSGSMVPHGGLRCAGVANHRPALLYMWSTHGGMTLGLFLANAGPEAALAESTDVLGGLDP
jgi:hypothetical protein